MAVSSGSFSIREYVLNKRSSNQDTSWPFDGSPMEVKKFLYWEDEVEKLKAKGKGPKKRSIADIFAVAPYVEREDLNEDYLDESEEDDDPTVLALCDVALKEKILAKKKGSCPVHGKEKPRNANSSSILKSSLPKGSEENTSSLVPTIKKKRSKLKCLARQKLGKSVETPKLTKHNESDFNEVNIHKSCTKDVQEEDSIICTPQLHILEIDQPNLSINTGETTGPNYANIQNLGVTSLCVNDHLLEKGKDSAANKKDDGDQNNQSESEVCLAGEKMNINSSCHPELQNLLKPDIGSEKYLSSRLKAENQAVPRSEDLSSYASSSRFSHLRNEDDHRNSIQVVISTTTTNSSTEFVDNFPRTLLPFHATYMEAQGRFPFSSQNGNSINYDNSGQHRQSYSCISHGELLRSIVPLSKSKQQPVPCSLPLNSHGELVPFKSSGSCKGTSSSVDLSHFRDNINGGSNAVELFRTPPVQNIMTEGPGFSGFHEAPSRKEGNYFEFLGENSRIYNLESTMEQMHPNKYLQNQYKEVHNHMGNGKRSGHMSQPTMRLMGKEIVIGKSNDHSQSSEDGNVWTDKQIVAEHHAALSSGTDTPSSKTQKFEQEVNLYQDSGKTIEKTVYNNKHPIHQLSQSFMEVDGDGSRLPYPLLTETYPHLNPVLRSNYSSQFHPDFRSALSKPSDPVVYGYRYESAPRGNLSPDFGDTQKQHALPSSSYRPSFEFPFLHPVGGDNVDSSSNSLSWLLNTKQHKETPATSYTSYFYVRDMLPPSTVSVPSLRAMSSYVPSPVSSLSDRQGSTFAHSGSMPTSLMNNIHGHGMIPKLSMKDFDRGKATRKRKADKLNDSAIQTMLPNLNLNREKISKLDAVVELLEPDNRVLMQGPNVIEDHSRLAGAANSSRVPNLQKKLTPLFRF